MSLLADLTRTDPHPCPKPAAASPTLRVETSPNAVAGAKGESRNHYFRETHMIESRVRIVGAAGCMTAAPSFPEGANFAGAIHEAPPQDGNETQVVGVNHNSPSTARGQFFCAAQDQNITDLGTSSHRRGAPTPAGRAREDFGRGTLGDRQRKHSPQVKHRRGTRGSPVFPPDREIGRPGAKRAVVRLALAIVGGCLLHLCGGCAAESPKSADKTGAEPTPAAPVVAPSTEQKADIAPVTEALSRLEQNQGTLTAEVSSITKSLQESRQATGGILAATDEVKNTVHGMQKNLDASTNSFDMSKTQLEAKIAEVGASVQADGERQKTAREGFQQQLKSHETALEKLQRAVSAASAQAYQQQEEQTSYWRNLFFAGLALVVCILGMVVGSYAADEGGASPGVRIGARVFAAACGGLTLGILTGLAWAFLWPVISGGAPA